MRAAPLLLLLLWAPAAATPLYAVRSARACDTCHVAPDGWTNPELGARKCTLDCQGCHVSPSGAGMRTVSGRYYGTRTLPMFLRVEDRTGTIQLAASQPSSLPSQAPVPAPGSAGRYGGLTPHPTFEVGGDLRLMLYGPLAEHEDVAVFPMQADVYLAARPYNPDALNRGRLTALVNAGFRGARGEQFDAFHERAFVREWYLLYDDLPYQLYARAGRFLPAHGWRMDDHTPFIRQGQLILGGPFDFERQVTGVEVGANPNYAFVRLSLFNASDSWDRPLDASDGGWGGALHAGWRDLAWHASGSMIYGRKGDADQVAWSVQWALNPEVWVPGLPLVYLGELHLNHQLPHAGDGRTGTAALHELNYTPLQGLTAKVGVVNKFCNLTLIILRICHIRDKFFSYRLAEIFLKIHQCESDLHPAGLDVTVILLLLDFKRLIRIGITGLCAEETDFLLCQFLFYIRRIQLNKNFAIINIFRCYICALIDNADYGRPSLHLGLNIY